MKTWWKIWWSALAIKLLLAAWIPLTPDEAYYWVWSQYPSLSYFDHPPAVAWLMTLGDFLPTWAVRWPAVALAHTSLWFWARLTANFLNPTQQLVWLCLALLMPLTGLGSLIVTPDLPLMFCWSLALWTFSSLLQQTTWRSAILFGCALGLGVLSKYHVALLGPICLYLWWSHSKRPALKRWLPLTILFAILISSPVWIWNIQNDWASFRFQLDHGLGSHVWKPFWTRDYILAQIGLLFPTIVWLALKSRAPLELRVAAWFPLIFFLLTTFRGYAEANWPIVAHPLILALAVASWPTHRRALLTTGATWGAVLLVLLGLVALPTWPMWVQKTKLRDLRQFDSLAKATQEMSPLYARSYQMAAALSFKQQRPVYKLRGLNRHDFFDSLVQSIPNESRIFLAVEKSDALPPPWDEWRVASVVPVGDQFEIRELEQP
ncbi:MAG: ArnT family glycosyltransferase [Bdellovibrionales bacterium]